MSVNIDDWVGEVTKLVASQKNSSRLALISTVIAAASAALTMFTALSVYRGEHFRLRYEQLKYTSEIYARWMEAIEKAGPILDCAVALNKLDDKDFRAVLGFPVTFELRPDSSDHLALVNCLSPSEREDIRADPKKWQKPQSDAVRHRIVTEVNQLDSLMIAFVYSIGNRFVICQNLTGLTTKQSEPSILRALLVRIREYGLMPGAPNLWTFMDTFKELQGCGAYTDEIATVRQPQGLLGKLGVW